MKGPNDNSIYQLSNEQHQMPSDAHVSDCYTASDITSGVESAATSNADAVDMTSCIADSYTGKICAFDSSKKKDKCEQRLDNPLLSPSRDILTNEGINSKGFGIVTKFAMTDRDLSLEAKAIYAYICSLAGRGTTAFPSRDTICSQLNMKMSTYKTHFRILRDAGYISAEQRKTVKNGVFKWGSNLYTIISNPKRFEEYAVKRGSANYDILLQEGIKSSGYGTIPFLVMSMPGLHPCAKAIYAYFCSFAGAGQVAFPSNDTILYHLNICGNTYKKYMLMLKNIGLIVVKQSREANGVFGKNIFILKEKGFKDSTEASEYPTAVQNTDHGNSAVAQNTDHGIPPQRKIPTTGNMADNGGHFTAAQNTDHGSLPQFKIPTAAKPTTTKPTATKQPTTNNSLTINSIYHDHYPSNQSAQSDGWTDGMCENIYVDGVSTKMPPKWAAIIRTYKQPEYSMKQIIADEPDEEKRELLTICIGCAADSRTLIDLDLSDIDKLCRCSGPSLPNILMSWAIQINAAYVQQEKEEQSQLRENVVYGITNTHYYDSGSVIIEEIFDIITEVMGIEDHYGLYINGNSVPAHIVKEVYKSLNLDMVEEVARRYELQGDSIKKPKEYLRTMLYNIPMGWVNEQNREMYNLTGISKRTRGWED